MFCSGSLRNIFLVSGVLISHILVLLALLSMPDINVNPSAPEVLMVNLSGVSTSLSSRKKLSSTSVTDSSSNAKSSSLATPHEPGVSGYGKEISHGVDRAVRTPRAAIHSPKPHYPLASRQLREQGLVIVKLCVNEQGIVNQVSLTQSSGFHGLDNSALKALALWRFAPINLSPINASPQCFQSPVQFTLGA